jgi:hypothetical protein
MQGTFCLGEGLPLPNQHRRGFAFQLLVRGCPPRSRLRWAPRTVCAGEERTPGQRGRMRESSICSPIMERASGRGGASETEGEGALEEGKEVDFRMEMRFFEKCYK